MSDLFGNHIVGFSTRRLILELPPTQSPIWQAILAKLSARVCSATGLDMSLHMRKTTISVSHEDRSGVPTRTDTKQPVQSQ